MAAPHSAGLMSRGIGAPIARANELSSITLVPDPAKGRGGRRALDAHQQRTASVRTEPNRTSGHDRSARRTYAGAIQKTMTT
jgi:hypothetical protein